MPLTLSPKGGRVQISRISRHAFKAANTGVGTMGQQMGVKRASQPSVNEPLVGLLDRRHPCIQQAVQQREL
jgi:hypothetical protein